MVATFHKDDVAILRNDLDDVNAKVLAGVKYLQNNA